MTHIIMSGPIKPLTEVERHFAKLKLRKIRAGDEEPKVVERPLIEKKGCEEGRWRPFEHQVIIDKRLFVTYEKASMLLGVLYRHTVRIAGRDCWETKRHPTESRVVVCALKDVLQSVAKIRKRKEGHCEQQAA